MSALDVMLEAERRGILPPDKKSVLDEARKRGFAPAAPGIDKPTPTMGEIASDVGEQSVRGFNRGLNSVLSLPGAIVGGAVDATKWAVDKATGLDVPISGDAFRWNNPISRTLESADHKPETTAGRYADQVGQALGASSIPTVGMMAKAAQPAQQATSTLGQVGQRVVDAYRANPGAAVAADAVAATGAGVGQQAAEDMGFGAIGQTVGGVAGGLAPAAISAVTQGITQPIRRALSNQGETGAYNQVAKSLDGGIDQLASDVSTGASNLNAQVQRRTFDVLGEEMARANGNVPAAEAATLARLHQEFGLSQAQARTNLRNLASVHENSQLMLGEYPAVARADADTRLVRNGVNFDDLNRTEVASTQGDLDYLLNNGTSRSAKVTGDAVVRRAENLAPAVRESLERAGPQVGNRPADITDAAAMIETARQAASAEYRAAAANQRPFVNNLQRVLDAWNAQIGGRQSEVATKMREATDLFVDHLPIPNANTGLPGPNTTLRTVTDLRDFINRRTQLNRMIDDSYVANPQTGTDDPTAVTRWLERFKRHVDASVGAQNPEWRVANQRWADMNLERRATRLGDIFATRAGPQYRQQIDEFNGLAPEAQNIVRIHFLQKLYDKIENLPDTASVSKLFSNDHNRNMIRSLLGEDAARDFIRTVRDARVAERTLRSMGDTRTATRIAKKEQMETESGILGAMKGANTRGLLDWVGKSIAQVAQERRNRPMADILTTPMSDTARVAQRVHEMRETVRRTQQLANPPDRQPAAIGRVAPEINIEPAADDKSKKRPATVPAVPAKNVAPGQIPGRAAAGQQDEQSTIAQAREAIAKGAHPEQVKARLRLMKITPPTDL